VYASLNTAWRCVAPIKELFMKTLQTTLLASALLISAVSYAQSPTWQVQIGNQAEPRHPPAVQHAPQHGGFAVQAAQTAQPTVEAIQAQQDQRIRWAVQRGYIAEPDYRRLVQMQANIEHNRRIAYADGYFNVQEQQYVFGQLNLLSAEIDTVMLAGNFVLAYIQQFNTPIAVWALNGAWLAGRYDIRADTHHARAYRPAPQPPAVQAPPSNTPHEQPHRRNRLRDVLDPLGIFR
jgi:hypothetical protein